MRTTINELEGFQYRARFRENGVAIVPTTVHWRITREADEYVIQDFTEVTPASEVTVTVAGSLNAMTTGGPRESRRLTVVGDKDLDLEYSVDHPYDIRSSGR